MNTRKQDVPYVPSQTTLSEFTLKAILLGLIMAVVLGAANAYLGLKAGLTISATFPAAVIAIAAFRLPFMKGNILEQNIARTTASVGENPSQWPSRNKISPPKCRGRNDAGAITTTPNPQNYNNSPCQL